MKMKRMRITYGFVFVTLIMVCQWIPDRCWGYILPAEQIIQFMAKNFKPFETVYIIQTAYDDNHGKMNTAATTNEKIWIKSPHFYHAERMAPKTNQVEKRDHRFRDLLIANKEQRLIWLLNRMGVNVQEVAYTRINGMIAYRIGNKQASKPKILIEKERFLPLFLVYKPINTSSERTIRVRFKDYRKVEKGWYPFEIMVSSENSETTRLIVNQLKVNIPIPLTIFRVQDSESSGKEPDSAEENRLKRIIKAFDEKYR